MNTWTDVLDMEDKKILREVQRDANLSMERIAEKTNLSKTTVWNRLQKLTENGTILRQAAILDPRKVGLKETIFVCIRTGQHSDDWLKQFHAAIADMPQVTEAHRLAGALDYILKVQVTSTQGYDAFYKELTSRVSIQEISSSLSLEPLKWLVELDLDIEA